MTRPLSRTHVVLIPSYNTGPLLVETVRDALRHWAPVWVVLDGSTDASEGSLAELSQQEAGLRVIVRPSNGGKGAAVLAGAIAALAQGFSHALVMDADGQHPPDRIPAFMAASAEHPTAMVLGRPVFGPDAPAVRLQGRKLSVALVRCEILGDGIADPLFGFRVYPLAQLVHVMARTRAARRYDFDPEVAVRLFWCGTPTINLPAVCRYRTQAEGGVSHFHYVRDNARMVWLHVRLLARWLVWWPEVLRIRKANKAAGH